MPQAPHRQPIDWSDLSEQLHGDLVLPGDETYERASHIWNARLNRNPAAVARCIDADDIRVALAFARRNGVAITVRGGGHDYAGNSVCDNGLVIDLSRMDKVEIDLEARTARAQAGARWNAVDQASLAHGLAAAGGTVSSVGVAGFTLGGGVGHLVRSHGLAVDNLVSAEVITVDGKTVQANETENPDLFWAIRGGGGNFGIVTAFTFRLHKIGTQALVGQIIYPFEEFRQVMTAYREFMRNAPDELMVYAFLFRVPPIPAFAKEHHGEVVLDLVLVQTGDLEQAARQVQPLRELGHPILDAVGPQPYIDIQKTFDAGMPAGLRWFSRAGFLDTLTDEALDIIEDETRNLAGITTIVYLTPGGGAVNRVAPTATPYPHRSADYAYHIFPGWIDEADDEANISWARAFQDRLAPLADGGVYVNMLGEDETDRVRAAYGANFDRLMEIKRKWDPDNILRRNHNIPPANA